uniref:Uncharacterized protein n=1 Tax=Arion vulgaris TaxID=1028688 RepID=A0A0B7BN76_9EUPU
MVDTGRPEPDFLNTAVSCDLMVVYAPISTYVKFIDSKFQQSQFVYFINCNVNAQ